MRWDLRGRTVLRRLSELKRSERGQASVMIGMMMTTFILFFCFVVNTGMLVNAKINLQNAADLAAYAGAATQARLLNQISYLNYEMRRQYKKFLFRYYVMGNMAQKNFPRDGGGGGAYFWSPDGSKPLGVPMVCLIFNPNDNYCQVPNLARITIPTATQLDAIQSTLISQLQQIENIRQANCAKIGDSNLMVLNLWLWNTDPTLQNIGSRLSSSQQGSLAVIQGLAAGLGLIPRELILWRRIQTLMGYVNQTAAKNVTKDMVEGMLNDADPASKERTVQAFFSAYYTLGNHTFDGGNVIMDELVPSSLLALKDIKAKFDTFAIKPVPDTANSVNGAANCELQVEADTVQDKVPLGVYKDPSVMTYYAIRLKAKAKVMFNPFGPDVELKAYAAAQPFGSRIGPQLAESDFVRTDASPSIPPAQGASASLNFAGQVPNLRFRTDDSTGAGKGWDNAAVLAAYYQKFKPPSNGQNAQQRISVITEDNMQLAYQAAMVPNPWEGNQYNIINDLVDDPFVHNFDANQFAAFWAPVFPPGGQQDPSAELQSLIDSLMSDTGGGDRATLKAAIKKQMSDYLNQTRNGQGEDGEGFLVVRLANPLVDRVGNLTSGGTPPQPISIDPKFGLTDPIKIKTSWNTVNNGAFQQAGRVGYSVKFVSFDSLTANKQKTTANDLWTNQMDLDAEASADVPFIRH